MSEIASARINSFAPVAQQAEVSPSEPIFVLTGSQLQDLIKAAVVEAIQPLQDEVRGLKVTVANLEGKVSTLESTQDLHAENQFIQLKLINDLRDAIKKEPQPLQRDRGEILRALLAANDGKMLAKEARQKMHLRKELFSQLLAKTKDIEIRPYRMDKRQKLLVLR